MQLLDEPPFRFVLANDDIGTEEITPPDGWDDMQHTILRDAVYHGIAVKYSLDFNFIQNGREFLQTVYHNSGIEGVVLLLLYELDANEHKYFLSYSGRINLSAYRVTEIDSSTNAEETGFTRALLNLDDVEVDLTSTVALNGNALQSFTPAFTPISLHSKAVVKRYSAAVSNKAPAWNYRPVSSEDETRGTLTIAYDDEKVNEFDAYNYGTGLDFSKWSASAAPADENEIIEFKASAKINVTAGVNVLVQCGRGVGSFEEAKIWWYIGLNNQREQIYYWYSRQNGGNLNSFLHKAVTFNIDRIYNVVPGDKFYLYGKVELSDIDEPFIGSYEFEWEITPNEGTYINVSGSTTTAPSNATGFMLHELFARNIGALTGRNDAFYSELLGRTDSQPTQYAQDGEMSMVMVLNGSAIRGFSLSDRPLFAALKEAYSSLNAVRPIGLGVEQLPDGGERVRLEGVEHFYQSVVVLQLGRVASLKLSVAPEYYATEVEVGYDKWESGEDNSLDEVNTKQIRSTAITQLRGKYTATSKYSASGYLIEDIRRIQYNETPSKEDSNDKTNFFICVLRKPGGGFETERNQRLLVANNVLSPETMYNAPISPFRNFLRHSRLINAGLYKIEKKPVRFTQGNANYLFESQFIGETSPIIENQEITGLDMAKALWIPEYYEFTVALPAFQRKLIEANPYGLITFEDSFGNVKKGFLKEVKAKLTDGTADFKLLRYNE